MHADGLLMTYVDKEESILCHNLCVPVEVPIELLHISTLQLGLGKSYYRFNSHFHVRIYVFRTATDVVKVQ